MRNQIDLSKEPETVFLNPWTDGGLSLLSEPAYVWREGTPTPIDGIGASTDTRLNDQIEGFLAQTRRHRKFSKPVIYNSVAAVLEDVGFRKSFVTAQDRVVLGGAAGFRALNRYRWTHTESDFDPQQRVIDYFTQCRAANRGKKLPVDATALGPDVDFAITCRNTFNYYHFITESLCQLCVLDNLDFHGRIFIHFPNAEEKTRDFVRNFVEVLFPEYKDRVFFERAPKEYDRVLTAFDLIGAHYQNPYVGHDQFNALAPSAQFWRGADGSVASQGLLQMNAISNNLIALRTRAHKAIRGMDFSDLPKRFYVGRDTRQSRTRHMEGEDELFDHLRLFGFEYVVFESLHPLEQVAIMANAEMMISYHGAGFTNMLFASPETHVIEIGTQQTAMNRWGDFWSLAQISQCKYMSFFADYKNDADGKTPKPFKDDLIPAALSHAGIGQVMAYVVAVQGHQPDMPTADDLLRLGRALSRMDEMGKAGAMLIKHPDLTEGNIDLLLLLADYYKYKDDPEQELVTLGDAFKADPSRWQTLIRVIWCANRCERPKVLRWAMTRLERDFPDRHNAFVSNHEWVRYVV